LTTVSTQYSLTTIHSFLLAFFWTYYADVMTLYLHISHTQI